MKISRGYAIGIAIIILFLFASICVLESADDTGNEPSASQQQLIELLADLYGRYLDPMGAAMAENGRTCRMSHVEEQLTGCEELVEELVRLDPELVKLLSRMEQLLNNPPNDVGARTLAALQENFDAATIEHSSNLLLIEGWLVPARRNGRKDGIYVALLLKDRLLPSPARPVPNHALREAQKAEEPRLLDIVIDGDVRSRWL